MAVQSITYTRSQRRFDRGSWLTLGFVLSFTVFCVAVSAFILTLPGDGCQLNATADSPAPFTACFGDWPTPLRPGDKLLSVNGVSATDVDSFGLVRTPLDWIASSTASYVVLRDGAPTTLVVPIRSLSAAGVLRVFGAALLGQLSSWVLPVFLGSLVVFLLSPRAGAAQRLLISSSGLFAVTTFVWSASTVATLFRGGPAWALYIEFVMALFWGWLFIPCALLIVLSFPRRVWPLTRWPRATPVLVFGLPLVGTAFAVATGDLEPYGVLLSLSALAVVVGGLAITLHTFLRVRDPVVRAQTAWMALGLIAGFGFWPLSGQLLGLIPGVREALNRLPAIDHLLQFGVGLIFPISMGIAITRYRLFDIEVIIRRTLVYSVLTLALGLVYIGCIVVMRELIAPLTGGSDLAIVASTLTIAALFNPLRRRIQAIIDRRFYRRKYNAAKVLAAFGATARDETDLDALTAEILRVVDTTMQPEFVGLWLRERQAGSGIEDRG